MQSKRLLGQNGTPNPNPAPVNQSNYDFRICEMVCVLHLDKSMSMMRTESLKALIRSQLHPVKTLKQMVNDRVLYRSMIAIALVLNWLF